MKIVRLETWNVSVPYLHDEISSRVARGGVTDTIVRLTADNGLIGWGECTTGPDVASIEQAVRSAIPFVVGRDPWQSEAIARDFFRTALWDHRPQTGNFAFAGIDQALWDLCGKECGQPLYRLFGGALREEVDYFYYLARGLPADIARQAADGVARGYTCFYLKVGLDERAQKSEGPAAVVVGQHEKRILFQSTGKRLHRLEDFLLRQVRHTLVVMQPGRIGITDRCGRGEWEKLRVIVGQAEAGHHLVDGGGVHRRPRRHPPALRANHSSDGQRRPAVGTGRMVHEFGLSGLFPN